MEKSGSLLGTGVLAAAGSLASFGLSKKVVLPSLCSFLQNAGVAVGSLVIVNPITTAAIATVVVGGVTYVYFAGKGKRVRNGQQNNKDHTPSKRPGRQHNRGTGANRSNQTSYQRQDTRNDRRPGGEEDHSDQQDDHTGSEESIPFFADYIEIDSDGVPTSPICKFVSRRHNVDQEEVKSGMRVFQPLKKELEKKNCSGDKEDDQISPLEEEKQERDVISAQKYRNEMKRKDQEYQKLREENLNLKQENLNMKEEYQNIKEKNKDLENKIQQQDITIRKSETRINNLENSLAQIMARLDQNNSNGLPNPPHI